MIHRTGVPAAAGSEPQIHGALPAGDPSEDGDPGGGRPEGVRAPGDPAPPSAGTAGEAGGGGTRRRGAGGMYAARPPGPSRAP